MFCPKCKSLLRPKIDRGKKVMGCSCGYSSETASSTITEKGAKQKEIQVVEEVETKPIVDAACKKCGHNKAYFWSIQTRASDEPETRFFKCTKCKVTWREYK
ncbi:MAG TPA: transcription factor S [Candidatus Nanoarchaeia archaeon]|nr:transcription factor S [Candidatus Nanoarchaeia archaeon]